MSSAAPAVGALGWKLATAVAIGMVSAPLAWACFAEAMSDRASGPQAALLWTPGRADLVAAVAEAGADGAKGEAERAAADTLARQALARDPLENRALRVLALDADRAGRLADAARLMTVLGRRSLRDVQVQLWLAERALAARDYGQAFLHMDVALRRDENLSGVLFPLMGDSLADPAALGPLTVRLAARPDWRKDFLLALAQRGDAADRMRTLLVALERTGAPPTDLEVGALVGRMAQDDYVRARETWRLLVPAAARVDAQLVYDGRFEGLSGPPPFNWRLGSARGATAELVRTPEGRSALQVQYSAGRRSTLAEQVVVLGPGHYRLSGEVKAEQGDAPVSLAWSVACAQGDEPIVGEARITTTGSGWRRFAVDFAVPATGCRAQWLSLANKAKDSFANVQAWFADLEVAPLAASAGGASS